MCLQAWLLPLPELQITALYKHALRDTGRERHSVKITAGPPHPPGDCESHERLHPPHSLLTWPRPFCGYLNCGVQYSSDNLVSSIAQGVKFSV